MIFLHYVMLSCKNDIMKNEISTFFYWRVLEINSIANCIEILR